MHNQLDNAQQFKAQSWLETFHFKSHPLPPSSAHPQDKSSFNHLTEETKCRNDSFITPSKALVNIGRGSVEMKNRITLRGPIYMVLGTKDKPFPRVSLAKLIYFFVKLINHSHEDCKPVSRARQLRWVSCLTLHIWLGHNPKWQPWTVWLA